MRIHECICTPCGEYGQCTQVKHAWNDGRQQLHEELMQIQEALHVSSVRHNQPHWSPPITPLCHLWLFAKNKGRCRTTMGLVCEATWNCRRITSESSSVFRIACCRMTSRVFALFTPSLESRSYQAASIAKPLTPTVKLYWAVVQVTPFFRDAHQI